MQVSKIQEGASCSWALLGFPSASVQSVAHGTRCQGECLRPSGAGTTEPQEDAKWAVYCGSHLGASSCEVVLVFVRKRSISRGLETKGKKLRTHELVHKPNLQ